MAANRFSNLSQYELTHLPAHLVGGQRIDDLIRLLTDEEFLEYKAESGMVLNLTDDLYLAITIVPHTSPHHQFIRLIHEAVSRDVDFIAQHPSTLFQCLWNSCWWYDTPEASDHYDLHTKVNSNESLPWQRPGSKLHTWMESWRNRKEQNLDFTWVRNYRPPIRQYH